MPYAIDGTLAASRFVHYEDAKKINKEYFTPMAIGALLTPEILALTPSPLCIHPPRRGGMPEIFEAANVWIVSSVVKDVIEELEPNIHTFIPMRLKVGDETLGNYTVLYIGQAIDAIDMEQTLFADGEKTMLRKSDDAIVLRGDLIRGRHLWRGGIGKMGGGGDRFWGHQFCSDALRHRIKELKFEGWRFRSCLVR